MSRERGAGDDLAFRGYDSGLMCAVGCLWLRGEISESFNCPFKASNSREFVMPEQEASLQEVPEKMALKTLSLAVWGESSMRECLLISLWGEKRGPQGMERLQAVAG